MYCGDETGSFIGDIGSHTSRFGYGGDDSPKYVVPSYVGSSEGGSKDLKVQLSCYNSKWTSGGCTNPLSTVRSKPLGTSSVAVSEHPIVDPSQYLQQGQEISDWDAYEALWQSAFETMRVRDRFKHTVGGGSIAKTSSEEDDKSVESRTTHGASGIGSTMMRPGMPDSKCMHPLLAVYPGCSHLVGVSKDAQSAAHRKQLIQMTELLMEKLDPPAVFLAPTPMLAAFSHGRQTALVVDIGAGGTRVTPVVDGFLLKQSQRRSGRGGDWLGNVQWKALLDHKTVLRPRYLQTGGTGGTVVPQARGIFHRWAMQDLMHELRTCEGVKLPDWTSSRTQLFRKKEREDSMETDDEEEDSGEENSPTPVEAATFELPDGTLIDLTTEMGKDMRRVPELLFSEHLPFADESYGMAVENQSILDQHSSLTNLPLHELINSSLSAVGDVDARKDLAASILLTGGSSLFAELEERLSYEVSQHVTYKTKVLASRYNVERLYASWIGGSILTSLGSFQQLWLGRTEYEEYGVTMALQRFP